MKILIVEDITLVAERIADLCRTYISNCVIRISHTLRSAKLLITEETFDLLLLDLNLNGEEGFDLLKEATAFSFQTIVITANKDQAYRAFDFGVFDFITKPISEKRFEMAIERFNSNKGAYREKLKYLAIKSRGVVELLDLQEITFIKASGNYSEINTIKSRQYLHDKNLDKLLKILPDNFLRIHRSYIIDKNKIKKVMKYGAGKQTILLNTSEEVPLSRKMQEQVLKDISQ